MKIPLILLSVVFAAGALHAEEKAPSEQLLELINFETAGIDAAKVSLGPVVESFRKQGMPEPGVQEIKAAMDAFLVRVMKDPQIKTEMRKLYETKFTQDELKQLVAFYQTPIGRKSLKEMPALMQEGALIGQQVAQKYAPELEKQISEIVAKHKPSADEPKGE